MDEGETEGPTPRMLAWARNSAAYRLSRKMMTERELSDAVSRKARQKFEEISDEQVAALAAVAVDFGRQLRALDDTSYAEIKVRSSARSGKSKRAIARKLVDKGIDRETVTAALAETDDLPSALIFARKRGFGPFRRAEGDEKRETREFSAFARNGFSFDITRRVMAMERDEAEAILADQATLGSL